MKKFTINSVIIIFALLSLSAFAQPSEFALKLWENYSQFKEEGITHRRFQHDDIIPLIKKLNSNELFNVQKVGESIEGRDLFLISVGEGDMDVFLWSQMHGDESTATMALFDIFNFISSEKFKTEKEQLFKNLKLHFLPMLNPDGAEVFQRRNALGIDVNRDALRLQSPEGKTLKRIRDSLDADFGFNLHDQSRYYNAEATAQPATLSFLAPAYNYEKEVNDVRGNAMKLIVVMNKELQQLIPGQVAKYNDDFEPRAFGDNIQKWGTSTILIESGGFLNDPDKQEIRKLNFLAILTALYSISNGDYKNEKIEDYQNIPENDSKLYDLKLTGLEYELRGNDYILDLGINHQEISAGEKAYYYRSQIADQGDLSTNYGYVNHDLTGYKITMGKIYPTTYGSLKDIEKLNFHDILSNGYSYIKVKDFPGNTYHTHLPVQVVRENFRKPSRIGVGVNPTFFLSKEGKLRYALINGYLVNLEDYDPTAIKNALILR